MALNSTQKVPNKDELAELNDKKDVALLQEKIYIELSKVDPRTDLIQNALIQLDSHPSTFFLMKLLMRINESNVMKLKNLHYNEN